MTRSGTATRPPGPKTGGCEACHGAGAAHVAYERGKGASPALAPPPRFGLPVTLKEKRPLSWTLDPVRGIWMREPVGRPAEHADTCARCHSRRGTIAEEDPGASIHDTHRLALLEEGLYFPDGQLRDEVFEHGSYLQSKMFAIGVGCFDCHEHGSRARTGGAASACANCHLRERFATPAHHFHVEGSPARPASTATCRRGRTWWSTRGGTMRSASPGPI
jgi:hypothetical protein